MLSLQISNYFRREGHYQLVSSPVPIASYKYKSLILDFPTAASVGTDCATQICPSCEEGEEQLYKLGKCCPDCVPIGCSNRECPLPKCLEGYTLARPKGECCPTCTLDCSAVLCPLIAACDIGFTLVVPEGQCCPRCVPDVADCLAVSCLRPVCDEGEELVTTDGECCPQCQPVVCTVQGQNFSTCASLCPRTCNSPPVFCPAVCVEGCACPPGQLIDTINNRCVTEDECPSTGKTHGIINIQLLFDVKIIFSSDPCDICPEETLCVREPRFCINPPCGPDLVRCLDADEVCSLELETGLCKGSFRKFFYNSTTDQCELFIYGGCGGNDNRFDTRSGCISACGE